MTSNGARMVVSGGAVSPENRSNEEIRANFAAAHEWVSDLCTGKRQWRMRVPVDAGDSDIVLSQAINDGEALLARIAAVEADRDMYAASLDSMTMRLVRLVEAARLTPTSDDGEGMEGALKHFIAAVLAASPTPTGPEPAPPQSSWIVKGDYVIAQCEDGAPAIVEVLDWGQPEAQAALAKRIADLGPATPSANA